MTERRAGSQGLAREQFGGRERKIDEGPWLQSPTSHDRFDVPIDSDKNATARLVRATHADLAGAFTLCPPSHSSGRECPFR